MSSSIIKWTMLMSNNWKRANNLFDFCPFFAKKDFNHLDDNNPGMMMLFLDEFFFVEFRRNPCKGVGVACSCFWWHQIKLWKTSQTSQDCKSFDLWNTNTGIYWTISRKKIEISIKLRLKGRKNEPKIFTVNTLIQAALFER